MIQNVDFAQLYYPFGGLPLCDLKDSSDFLTNSSFNISCIYVPVVISFPSCIYHDFLLSGNNFPIILSTFAAHTYSCPSQFQPTPLWLLSPNSAESLLLSVTNHFHMDPMVTFSFSANVLSQMHLTCWRSLSLNSFLSLFSYNLLCIHWGRLVLGIKNGTVKQGGCVLVSE